MYKIKKYLQFFIFLNSVMIEISWVKKKEEYITTIQLAGIKIIRMNTPRPMRPIYRRVTNLIRTYHRWGAINWS